MIRASRQTIWRAWTEPALLQRWLVPAPAQARIDQLDVRPGGALETSMREGDSEFVPHIDAVFLVVEPDHRLVFTNAVNSAWRPALPEPVAMTAEIVLGEHPDGTDYRVTVRHRDPAARNLHEDLGFFEGWGSVTDALTTLVESGEAS
ncbi:polyketide cyclase [Saccharopolyspora hirsuta]|uniref:Polyketide cyclase n=1 Tax=Saccharopolyspora hirsuta TaxID=1837 RepID=A0A5M7BIE6_SACHI|nr:polyketide cyclase [Saccharopolyspora hirsuta]